MTAPLLSIEQLGMDFPARGAASSTRALENVSLTMAAQADQENGRVRRELADVEKRLDH